MKNAAKARMRKTMRKRTKIAIVSGVDGPHFQAGRCAVFSIFNRPYGALPESDRFPALKRRAIIRASRWDGENCRRGAGRFGDRRSGRTGLRHSFSNPTIQPPGGRSLGLPLAGLQIRFQLLFQCFPPAMDERLCRRQRAIQNLRDFLVAQFILAAEQDGRALVLGQFRQGFLDFLASSPCKTSSVGRETFLSSYCREG